MKRVADSEFDLLTLVRALVGDLSPGAVEPLLRLPRKLPSKLGSTVIVNQGIGNIIIQCFIKITHTNQKHLAFWVAFNGIFQARFQDNFVDGCSFIMG